jgi:hypothetical protein
MPSRAFYFLLRVGVLLLLLVDTIFPVTILIKPNGDVLTMRNLSGTY